MILERLTAAGYRGPAPAAGILLGSLLLLQLASPPATAAAAEAIGADRTWGLGWDDGLTVRTWLGSWELALAAGPDDDLAQVESAAWRVDDPPEYQGLVEVPLDDRHESGWVRGQIGFRVLRHEQLALVVFTGLAYNWIDQQEKSWRIDPISGGYDGIERRRYTHRYAWDVALRPAWSPLRWLSIETSFGLRFTWENWDETRTETRAGVQGVDREVLYGEGSSFTDFGWEGLSSLAFIVWL
jgi:hypothetical protein